jgi:hypothetical protein
MPFNKVHEVQDDAASYPYMDKVHLTRAGLMLNTLDKCKAVPLDQDDIARLRALPAEGNTLSIKDARELGPTFLQFDGKRDDEGRFIIGILVVPMQEVDQIHCYPYSNNNEVHKMWPYDKHFMISNLGDLTEMKVQARNTHPLASEAELDELGKTHMAALSAIVLKFLVALQQGSLTLTEESKDYTKLNKKRKDAKKNLIKPDYLPEWK